ncbi:acyl carrier protein [Bradyrhizobium guangzhouense]|uniref:Acyl carrier protein n=1 Tax=Bradyrhizobium guangzhouense TaxID=1325095 RepID=A0AAE5X6J9_9BRAD|nr:acyl carrier protein [Bradyrhizobium guangzhouense]QAU49578.1 acyl carrier protein [Bradyrhizobium guangzhouense]RXH17694.1 acyl carrier protein [Bradyrhizobium guangzhouense]
MSNDVRSRMRGYIRQRLDMKGDTSPLRDDDLLFSSGRLDSLDAVEIVMTIEIDHGINFADINFDLTRLDSIDAIADLIERHAVSV